MVSLLPSNVDRNLAVFYDYVYIDAADDNGEAGIFTDINKHDHSDHHRSSPQVDTTSVLIFSSWFQVAFGLSKVIKLHQC